DCFLLRHNPLLSFKPGASRYRKLIGTCSAQSSRCSNHSLSLVSGDDLSFVNDMTRKRGQQRFFVQAAFHLQWLIQRIDVKPVMMRPMPRRRRGTAVADLPERI